MDIYGALAEQMYRGQVPEAVTEHIGRLIIENYGFSADLAEARWGRDEMHDSLPVLRRGDIETALLSLRGVFPNQVKVESVGNVIRNAYHREVYCGRVVMTESKVEAKTGPIREARFRESLARASQLSFNLLDDEADRRADYLWACFVHTPSDRLDKPSFIRVAFPLADGSWEHSVDLYDLVPRLCGYAESETLLRLREERRRRLG